MLDRKRQHVPPPDDLRKPYSSLAGSGVVGEGDENLASHRAVLLGSGDVFQRAGQDGMRLVLFAGRPLREPVAWGGPIVMNTPEELQQAFAEIENGTFIRTSANPA